MDVLAVALAALLAVAAVAFVARPFLAEPDADDDHLAGVTPAEEQRLQLVERRDRALGALKELEFDHRTGKIADPDYEASVRALRGEAAAAMRALEPAPAAVPGRAEKVDTPA